MSKYFRKSNLFSKQKFVSIPEEVGMDIVEALDVLEFTENKKIHQQKQFHKNTCATTEKIELDNAQNEKCCCIKEQKIVKSKLCQKYVPKKNDNRSCKE